MAKKHKHEDHINHEAWAIPYGDLITLLLAFFVVMYSMSSVNEGKYRVLADSLNAAFGGSPKSPKPINIGEKALGSESSPKPRIMQGAPPRPGFQGGIKMDKPSINDPIPEKVSADAVRAQAQAAREQAQLARMSDEVKEALGDLIDQDLVLVRKHETWLEVEIKADVLFPSGSARMIDSAQPVVDRLADVLKQFDNVLKIEGHTDNMPIATREFPSNWELSSARAATVVHRFMAQGVDPLRMSVLGLGEYRPVGDNATPEGRNRNRRVVIVVLSAPSDPARPALPTQEASPPERTASSGDVATTTALAQP
jgi:chemotaxis protein MotB